MSANVKLAIIIGHTKASRGAVALEPIKKSEWEFHILTLWPKIEAIVKSHFPHINCKMFDKSAAGYAETGKQVDKWIGDTRGCAIELHFNSASDPKAFGTETLVEGNDLESIILGLRVHRAMCECFERVTKGGDRGLKKLKPDNRGHYPLRCVKSPICLVEPTFAASNLYESGLLFQRVDDYALSLVVGANNYLLNKQATMPKPKRG